MEQEFHKGVSDAEDQIGHIIDAVVDGAGELSNKVERQINGPAAETGNTTMDQAAQTEGNVEKATTTQEAAVNAESPSAPKKKKTFKERMDHFSEKIKDIFKRKPKEPASNVPPASTTTDGTGAAIQNNSESATAA